MQAINRLLRKIVIAYPHLFRCSTIKYHKLLSTFVERPLCCLAYHFFITLFSFQGSIFQLLLQPDLKICLYARSSNPTTNVTGMVGPSGLEPPTLRLSVVRSSQLSYGPVRRHKLHIPRRTACSTSRSFRCVSSSSQTHFAGLCSDFERLAIIQMVEIVGIEPATSCLQGRRSPS